MEGPIFADSIERRHRQLDDGAYEDIYVVGDVHGCRETFERLLNRLALGPDDLVVAVGDVVRKGPDSAGALDVIRCHDQVISVRGNNEQHLITGRKHHHDHGPEDVAFMESLPLVVSWDGAVVVHGGIDHRKPLTEHSVADILNARSLNGSGYTRPYWFEARTERPRVFFGHTVLSEPYRSPAAVGLDTGCVYGGALTAYSTREDAFISVEPPTEYLSRDADSVVTPRSDGQQAST